MDELADEFMAQLLNENAIVDSIDGPSREIIELYKIAKERCSFLMTNHRYRKIILSDPNQEITLAKGYFQGCYEILLMVKSQIKFKK